ILTAYHWPGNVRELENIIQRAMVLASTDTITAKDLPPDLAAIAPQPASTPPASPPLSLDSALDLLFDHARNTPGFELLPAAERELIRRALTLTRGNQVKAAQLLGITRATLRKRVDTFGLKDHAS
ncbi:MAG: helix-turn-helix domain-containing protein, partial [Verrucomicrobiia bacterium]